MPPSERVNDLERALLTQSMSNPKAAELVAAMGIACWQNPVNAQLAKIIRRLWERGQAIDFNSLASAFGDKGIRDWFGGNYANLTDCLSSKNATLPPEHYRKMIEEEALKRKLQYGLDDAQRLMQDGYSLKDVNEHLSNLVVSSHTSSSVATDGPVLVCLADVVPKAVDWLWHGRIPLGRITLLVGYPGEGKSFLTTDMASRVSTGAAWPDHAVCPKGDVILVCAEDNAADTIRPRLDAHMADCSRVHLLKMVKHTAQNKQLEILFSLGDIATLEKTLQALPDCKLIVIDPIGSFLGGKVDSHRDNDVRGVLAPVAELAEKHGVAVVVVCHRPKGKGNRADDLVMGSRAFTGIARTVWHLSSDTQDKKRRLLLPGKNNLASEGDGLAFTIVGQPPRIVWEQNRVQMNADEGLAMENNAGDERKPGPEPLARNAARDWLAAMLANGSMTVPELKQVANNAGLTWRTLQRAAEELGIIRSKEPFSGNWRWSLPVDSS